jgi:hypothetical protein
MELIKAAGFGALRQAQGKPFDRLRRGIEAENAFICGLFLNVFALVHNPRNGIYLRS